MGTLSRRIPFCHQTPEKSDCGPYLWIQRVDSFISARTTHPSGRSQLQTEKQTLSERGSFFAGVGDEWVDR